VEGTFSWLKDNSDYKDWFRAQKTPFLCVSGPQGTGKTYLTYRCYQLLQEMIKPKTLTTETSKTRQNISVAYFFFDPGSETHSLKNALENLIVQIASQDSKYCDSLSKDIDKKGFEASKGDTAETLWKTFLSTKFEKTSEASRMAYILLDGIDLLSEEDLKALLDLFQDLGCDKTAIQIMMTGIPDKLKEMNLKPCEINLVARSKEHGDIKTIIAHRIKNMKNLKEFSEDNRKKIMEHLDSQSEGMSQHLLYLVYRVVESYQFLTSMQL
jgi:Cdc6-like AAA superfamily ATPase